MLTNTISFICHKSNQLINLYEYIIKLSEINNTMKDPSNLFNEINTIMSKEKIKIRFIVILETIVEYSFENSFLNYLICTNIFFKNNNLKLVGVFLNEVEKSIFEKIFEFLISNEEKFIIRLSDIFFIGITVPLAWLKDDNEN
jgi:hypothetical protein